MVGSVHAFAVLNSFLQLVSGHPSDIIHLCFIYVQRVAGGLCYAANHQLTRATTTCIQSTVADMHTLACSHTSTNAGHKNTLSLANAMQEWPFRPAAVCVDAASYEGVLDKP